MKSQRIIPGDSAVVSNINALRSDARAASWLHAHQMLGTLFFGAIPTTRQTLTLDLNRINLDLSLLKSIGTAAGNVLIGINLTASILNAFNLLEHPTVTTATGVALSATNAQLVTYVQFSLNGGILSPCSVNSTIYSPLTSFSASTTVSSSSYTAQTMSLYVEPGVFFVAGTRVVYAGGSAGTVTAPVTNPRIDLLTINSSGSLAWVTGTENVSPVPPTYPNSVLVLAEVWNVVGETQLLDNDNQTSGQGFINNDTRPFLGGAFNPASLPYSLVPAAASTYNLGSMAIPWNNVYATAFFAAGAQIGANTNTPYTAITAVNQGDGLGMYHGQVVTGILPFTPTGTSYNGSAPSREIMVSMDSTHFVVLYGGGGGSWFVRAGINIKGTITLGTAVTLSSTVDSIPSITMLDSTHFVCEYGSSTTTMRFVAGTLSGTNNLTVTMGSDTTISATSNGNGYFMVGIDSTHFACAILSSTQSSCVVGSISGTTITLGSVTNMGTSGRYGSNGAGGTSAIMSLQDGQHFVFTGQIATNEQWALIGATSGTTVSFGTEVGVMGATTGLVNTYVQIGYLDSSHFWFSYNPGSGAGSINCQVCSWSGTTITAGTAKTGTSNGTPTYGACVTIDSTHIVVVGGNSTTIEYFSISGTTLTSVTFKSTLPYASGCLLNYLGGGNLVLIAWNGTNIVMTSIQLNQTTNTFTIPGTATTIATTSQQAFQLLNMNDNATSIYGTISTSTVAAICQPHFFVGIAAAAAAAAGTVVAQLNGIVSSFSGLVSGPSPYYMQPNGSTSTVVSPYRLGYATSATSINVTTPW